MDPTTSGVIASLLAGLKLASLVPVGLRGRPEAPPPVELLRVIHELPDSVIVTDAQGTILYVNQGFERASGYAAEQVIGKPAGILRSGRHRRDFFERLWQTISRGEIFRGELVNRRRNGDLYHEDLLILPLVGDNGEIAHYVSVGRDITVQKQVATRIQDQAFYDPLTGAANFRLLRERARQILALARRRGHVAALLHIDLRRFAELNRTHGRTAGDECLRATSDRLAQGLRESDAFARLSSDEFVVLLSEVTDQPTAARVTQRLLASIERPVAVDDCQYTVKALAGIALFPQDVGNFDALCECAEVALDRARGNGRPFEFFQQEVELPAHDPQGLADDLRWAWENNQFVLHYQPIIASSSGEMVGAEALTRSDVVGIEAFARWPHVERGMVNPAQFIPLAEQTGRILSLDRWAIATAVRQAAAWSAQGWRGWISVNLSARSLHDDELATYVARTLGAHQLPPERLVIEITESAAMRDPDATARLLRRLKDTGVLLALDDFGTGHSSLAYLKRFPVDILKLDRSFIRDIGFDPRDEQLIEAMISLAHRIGARVIAEGVEEKVQAEWLREAGCDFVQGYLLGRPAPPSDVRPALPG